MIDNSYLNFDYDNDNSLEKYENSAFSKDIGNKYLKSIPKLKLGIEFKAGLSFNNTQSQFQRSLINCINNILPTRKCFQEFCQRNIFLADLN